MAERRATPRKDKVTLKSAKVIRPLWGSEEILRSVADDVESIGTGNCGLIFANGVEAISTIEHAFALRRLIGEGLKNYDIYLNDWEDDGPWGAVLATTIQSQRSIANRLHAAGFEQLITFENPNTGNTVTLWAALAIDGTKNSE